MKKSFIDKISLPNLDFINSSEAFQDVYDDLANMEVTPVSEIIAEQLKPILDKEEKVIEMLTNNYNKLNELYKMKEKELEDTKKDNKIMKRISIISSVVAVLSLIATILIGILT